VPISAALRQGPHIKVATVASRWQREGDLIGSGFEPHTSRTKSVFPLAPSDRLHLKKAFKDKKWIVILFNVLVLNLNYLVKYT